MITRNDKLKHMDEIRKISHAAAEYLEAIDQKLLFRADAEFPKYGILTNMAETMNGVFVSARGTTRLNLLKKIEAWAVEHMALRKQEGESLVQRGRALCDHTTEAITASSECIALYKFFPTNQEGTYIVQTDHMNQWQVDLNNRTCTCGRFYELQVPCVHALKVITAKQFPVQSYSSEKFLSSTVVDCYRDPFLPAIMSTLIPETNRLPPAFRNLAGRPRKRRISSRGERNLEVDVGGAKKLGTVQSPAATLLLPTCNSRLQGQIGWHARRC